MILIHGAPGSRLGFVNAFLTNTLLPNMYDVGQTSKFVKFHTYNKESVKKFNGKKIYIQLSNNLLFLHLFLFFEKNVLVQDPAYKQYHQTHRTLFDKFYYTCKMWFDDERITDTSLYDYVVPFEKTYDIDYLVELYQLFNGTMPSDILLESVRTTNLKNYPNIPENHAARVAASVFNFEYKNMYLEENRLWVVNEVAPFDHESGESLDKDNLYSNISKYLTMENYKFN